MNGIENYLGFILAGIVLNLTPGVDSIFIITRSVAQGRKAGVYSVFGIITGAICHTIFAAYGLSILLMKSAVIYELVKWAGAIYLIYLGVRMYMDKSNPLLHTFDNHEALNRRKIFRQGFFSNLLNPKVGLFFLSIMPQFIKPEYANGPVPFLILGFTFITTGTLWCLFLAYSASFMTQTLRKNDRIGEKLQKFSGLIFVGLGLQILLKKS